MKSLLRRAFAALGLAALLVAAPATARTESAHPALWSVSDADTTIYLFGTIHLLPDNYQWQTPKLSQAVQGSQELVVETIVDTKDPTKLMSVLAALGFAKGLPPLAERIPAEKRPALEAALKKSGVPRPYFDQMKTWTAAFLLLADQFRDMGLKGDQGVEQVLRDTFTSEGKPIGQLETNAQQFGFFNTLPEKAQVALLLGALDKPQDTKEDFAGMLKAWSRGDVEGIARTFDRDLAASPELRQTLIRQRNSNWSRWIGQRMGQPGAILIAVGAGHLAGDESVIAMLKKAGYRVRRVQ
ncbi:MAG TPA: TraB/GumN family protein [Sphingomicrobium sp.]|nr:TraB/GumN family protein [Sphingomicrobium sp.]